MSKHRVLMLCVLLAATALVVPKPAGAADSYEVVCEYSGPYYHVVNAPDVDQLVDDPLTETQFLTPYAVSVSRETGGRIMNYVLDSGNRRILGFETNLDVYRYTEASATYTAPAGGADQWDDNEIRMAEYLAAPNQWIIPYSEIVKVDDVTWTWVADLTGYTASDQVYTIDYDASSQGPRVMFPNNSLTSSSEFDVFYVMTDYRGGATAAFGLGDVDQHNNDHTSVITANEILIDESSPAGGASSYQDLRAMYVIDSQSAAASADQLWVLDAEDTSTNSDEYLQVFEVTRAGGAAAGVETYIEAYDDVLNSPSDIYVARIEDVNGVDQAYGAASVGAITGVATFDGITVLDDNQVTGHSYLISSTAGNIVTITDLTTSRVVLSNGDAQYLPTGATTMDCYVIPGCGADCNQTPGADSDVYTTTRSVPSRYGFVADRGNNRLKVIGIQDFDLTTDQMGVTNDDIIGDIHLAAAAPTADSLYQTWGTDYYITTPSTVPEDWRTGTLTRPVKENSIAVIEDPAGTAPVTWTRVDNLETAGPADKVYYLDWWEGSIVFGDGVHGAIPPASTTFSITNTTTPDVLRYGSEGYGQGQFAGPTGVAAKWSANLDAFVVYVTDTGNNRIQKFYFYPEDAALNIPPRMEFVCEWSTASTSSDLLSGPTDIDIETDGTYYWVAVVDYNNDRVVLYEDTKFDYYDTTIPTFETTIGAPGNSLGSYYSISCVELVQNGTEIEVYVADDARGVVTKYVKAPTPSITLVFTGNSALPNSFPPSGNYPISFTTTNAPEGGWVDFYFDTASTFSTSSANLCILAGSTLTSASPASWVFANSPGGTPADGDYHLYAVLRDASGNQVAIDQATSTELLTIDSNLVPAVQVRDEFDGDAIQLIAPREEQFVLLQLSYPDSAIGCSFVGTFPAELLQIQNIDPGDGWWGTGYINHLFETSWDNTNGTFEVYSSVTGVPQGLTGSGNYSMARIHVLAHDALSDSARVRTGAFTLDTSASAITDYSGATVSNTAIRNLDVKLAYVGDIANATTGTGGSVPAQEPMPDGYMSFADMVAFTTGWNGTSTTQDPISDMGPVSGSSPKLVPTRDHDWDVDDLIAFTGNWSWFTDNGYGNPSTLDFAGGASFSPLGEDVAGETSVWIDSSVDVPLPGHEMQVNVHVSDAANLTAAMIRITYDPNELQLLSTEKGELLARGDSDVLLNTVRRDGVIEICQGRLNQGAPGVSGSGVIATLSFRIASPITAGINYGYDLRDARNTVLSRGMKDLMSLGQGEVKRVLLCQNFPNPLSPRTSIVFTLPSKQAVDLAVFDLTGRRIRTLVDGVQDPGIHNIEWDGRSEAGVKVASGVYFYQMRAGDTVHSRKLVVTR